MNLSSSTLEVLLTKNSPHEFTVGQECFVLTAGIGKILGETTQTISGKTELCWQVELRGQSAVIPKNRAFESMRPLISQSAGLKILELLMSPQSSYDQRDYSLKQKDYFKAMTETGFDPEPMAKHLKALLVSPSELSFGEKKHLLLFEDLVVREVAITSGSGFDTVIDLLRKNFPQAYSGIAR